MPWPPPAEPGAAVGAAVGVLLLGGSGPVDRRRQRAGLAAGGGRGAPWERRGGRRRWRGARRRGDGGLPGSRLAARWRRSRRLGRRRGAVKAVQVVQLHQRDQVRAVLRVGRVHAGQVVGEGVGHRPVRHRAGVVAAGREQLGMVGDRLGVVVVDAELRVHRHPVAALVLGGRQVTLPAGPAPLDAEQVVVLRREAAAPPRGLLDGLRDRHRRGHAVALLCGQRAGRDQADERLLVPGARRGVLPARLAGGARAAAAGRGGGGVAAGAAVGVAWRRGGRTGRRAGRRGRGPAGDVPRPARWRRVRRGQARERSRAPAAGGADPRAVRRRFRSPPRRRRCAPLAGIPGTAAVPAGRDGFLPPTAAAPAPDRPPRPSDRCRRSPRRRRARTASARRRRRRAGPSCSRWSPGAALSCPLSTKPVTPWAASEPRNECALTVRPGSESAPIVSSTPSA